MKMINLEKIKQEKCQPSRRPAPAPTILHTSTPFLIFQILPPPLGEVIKIHFPPLKRGLRGVFQTMSVHPLKRGLKGMVQTMSAHWSIKPLSKKPAPLSCQAPFKSTNCPSLPLFRKFPLSSILVFHEPSSKS